MWVSIDPEADSPTRRPKGAGRTRFLVRNVHKNSRVRRGQQFAAPQVFLYKGGIDRGFLAPFPSFPINREEAIQDGVRTNPRTKIFTNGVNARRDLRGDKNGPHLLLPTICNSASLISRSNPQGGGGGPHTLLPKEGADGAKSVPLHYYYQKTEQNQSPSIFIVNKRI